MAYIPDKAFIDIEEVGHKAFLLYSFYCMHGGMNNNVVSVCLEKGAAFVGVVYENACRLSAKLKKAGWIKHKNGKTILVKGFEHLLKTDENDSFNKNPSPGTDKNNSNSDEETDENDSSRSDVTEELTKMTVLENAGNPKTDKNDSFKQKTDEIESSENIKTDENDSLKLTKTSVAYKEEPASFNQQEKKKEKDISVDISKKKKEKFRNFTDGEKAERLFDFWKKRMKSKRHNFTESRKKKAVAILKNIGYMDCLRAIIGCQKSDWHMGRDPNNRTLYNEFERIFDKTESTEKFIARYFQAIIYKGISRNGVNNGTIQSGKPGKTNRIGSGGNGSSQFDAAKYN